MPHIGLGALRAWCCIFVPSETMPALASSCSRNAQGHVLFILRETCCLRLLWPMSLLLARYLQLIISRTSIGHRALLQAWRTVKLAHVHQGTLFWQQRCINVKDYYTILHKYWAAYVATHRCPSKSSKQATELSDAEWKELANLLATPLTEDENLVRFESGSAA